MKIKNPDLFETAVKILVSAYTSGDMASEKMGSLEIEMAVWPSVEVCAAWSVLRGELDGIDTTRLDISLPQVVYDNGKAH